MKADDIERSYQEITFGHDEPDIMYLSGKTLKYMAIQNGHPALADSEGNLIRDNELYCLMADGIWLVE
jgi:hypothetical protein